MKLYIQMFGRQGEVRGEEVQVAGYSITDKSGKPLAALYKVKGKSEVKKINIPELPSPTSLHLATYMDAMDRAAEICGAKVGGSEITMTMPDEFKLPLDSDPEFAGKAVFYSKVVFKRVRYMEQTEVERVGVERAVQKALKDYAKRGVVERAGRGNRWFEIRKTPEGKFEVTAYEHGVRKRKTRGKADRRVDLNRVAELGDDVLKFFEVKSKPHEAALVARLVADVLEAEYGMVVDSEAYERILRQLGIRRAAKESGELDKIYG